MSSLDNEERRRDLEFLEKKLQFKGKQLKELGNLSRALEDTLKYDQVQSIDIFSNHHLTRRKYPLNKTKAEKPPVWR